jgi:hypothetical protein
MAGVVAGSIPIHPYRRRRPDESNVSKSLTTFAKRIVFCESNGRALLARLTSQTDSSSTDFIEYRWLGTTGSAQPRTRKHKRGCRA